MSEEQEAETLQHCTLAMIINDSGDRDIGGNKQFVVVLCFSERQFVQIRVKVLSFWHSVQSVPYILYNYTLGTAILQYLRLHYER